MWARSASRTSRIRDGRGLRAQLDVTATVTLTTDSVGETHIDGDEPRNFTDVFRYSIKTDDEGLVVGGEWKNDKDHPDFAWIPYHNTTRRETGGSENPSWPTVLCST